MSYLDLLEDETIKPQYLAVLKPRRRATGFSLVAGSIYKASFDLGEVVSCQADDTPLTAAASSALSADEFYYDVDAAELYVRLTSGVDPDTVFLVATYEIYVATLDAHWHRIPSDTSTRTVYFEPVILQSPILKQSMADSIFGFTPVESSRIVLVNTDHWIEKHLYDSSFAGAAIELYHWLEELDVDNIKLVMKGLLGDIKWSSERVTIDVKSSIEILSAEYRPAQGESFFNSSDWPDIDQQYIARPIRRVYGLVDGFQPVNVDFNPNTPTISDNRTWVVCNGQDGLDEIVRTVVSNVGASTTRTYVSSTQGLNEGDSIWFDRAVGTDEYQLLTNVNRVSNYVEHAALATPMAASDHLRRGFVGRVEVFQNGVAYTAHYNRDYTVSTLMGAGASGFTFSSSMESNVGLPLTLQGYDKVCCRVYGPATFLTLGGPSFGANDPSLGNLATVTEIILDLLKTNLQVTDAEINQASFTSALAERFESYGLAIPQSASGSFPIYRDLISSLLESGLLQLTLDEDQKWKLVVLEPLGTSDYSVGDDEILKDSFDVSYSYSDIVSDIIVEYAAREVSSNPNVFSEEVRQITLSSDAAKYVHKANKSHTVRTPFVFEDDALSYAQRLCYALGEQQGQYNISVKNRFFEANIGDIIEVDREKIPGFDYAAGTTQTRTLKVLGIEKSLTKVNLTLTDQKGIQDNESNW